ncbi:MAG: type IV pilus secretin PilQ [Fluviicoccus sp.]|uniref:type IV pilus secretin PilQ n=1 Tax=Fluviicoccus sp. TaxID=2003552 RepID=UPI00271B3764|nr:type IV pilus secretin PilQ [Fluviicoccus sp.]MDO8331459.1 type IV pilus secretin PilQ [Fluviicoccus sp.]
MINRINMNNNKVAGAGFKVRRLVLGLGLMSLVQFAAAAERMLLKQIDFVTLPGDEIEVKLAFDQTPPQLQSYKIDKPARLVFDLPNTRNGLPSRYLSLGNGNARSLTVIDNQERTRLVVNLGETSGYVTRVEGNNLVVRIGKGEQQGASALAVGNQTLSPSSTPVTAQAPVAAQKASRTAALQVENVDFRRGEQGDGQVLIGLSQSSIPVDVMQQGNKIFVRFLGAKVPEKLRRRLDVTDFATPVKLIESYNEGNNGVMVIQPQGEFEYLAYQTDTEMTISVKPVLKEERRRKEFVYTGEKLSLNFQDIEVRSVLQLIADFTSLNLVASDTVSGRITLRLQNVPWDQALDLILKTKGLDKRTVGNVMLVAPADEIAARERLEIESQTQSEQIAPLRTEFIQVNYAKAADIQSLISSGTAGAGSESGTNSLLSPRGSASVDARTNMLVVQDTAKKIDEIRELIAKLDVPVKQVMIEARIVLADSSFAKELGVKWGVAHDNFRSNKRLMAGGSTTTLDDLRKVAIDTTTGLRTYEITKPKDLAVDLGIDKAGASSLALGIMDSDNIVLDLELSALQSDGHGEVIATPRVLTADKQKARVATGKQIPYQESTSSGATSVKFVNAELSLEVTPSITPDGRINMELFVNNDSLGEVLANGAVTINTNRVTTNILVDDGQTVVLGGIFKESSNKGVIKTPVLGDIPYLGRLFKQEIKRSDKVELLIFVTPRLMTDTVAGK